MSDLLNSFKTGASTPADMAARKEAMMNSVRSELALANAQELMNKTNEKCFLKCIAKPGASLSSSEQACLTNCWARYMEAFNIVSRKYKERMSKELLATPGPGFP